MYYKKIVFDRYIREVELSQSRRKKYYVEGEQIPEKYLSPQYAFKKGFLFNLETKERVIKNERVAGTPKIIPISGRAIYSGWHERIRIKVVGAIKDFYRPIVQRLQPVSIQHFPLRIRMELHTPPRNMEWDLDNLWIYSKCFQDLLKDEGVIPNDSIRYITLPPAPEYYPVSEDDDRKIIFYLESDTRSIINHVMFRHRTGFINHIKSQYSSLTPVIYLSVDENLKVGRVDFVKEEFHYKCSMSIGKRQLLYGALSDSLSKVYYKALQYNTLVVIDRNLGTEFSNYDYDKVIKLIETNLSNRGIDVIIHNEQ